MSDMDELKRLTPEERIKKLRQIEKDRRREIEEAEALIRDSMRELHDVEDRKHAPIEQMKADDISQLLTAEEKRMFKTARFQEIEPETAGESQQKKQHALEEVADEEARNSKQQEQGKPLYGQALEEARKGIDYSSHLTTTGQDSRGKEGVEKIYSSRTVTGEEGSKSMYELHQMEERTSGLYGKNEEHQKKKRVETW